jgi:LDH2 family malate/lactate/ureidoglycolate dehydrogenase
VPQIAMEILEPLCADVLAGAGMRAGDAAVTARHLIDAEMKGVVSHGVQRVAYYLEQFDIGGARPAAEIAVEHRGSAVARIDGGTGLGILAMERAVEEALAMESPIVSLAIENVAHTGRMGCYTERLAQKGKLAIAFGGGGQGRFAMVAPHGGRGPHLSTNPWAIAMPGGRHGVVSVDFATCVTANGKIRLKRNAGEDLPVGWVIDKHGNPSTKVADYDDGGAILPMGAHKGYGMGLIAELVGFAMLPDSHEFHWLLIALDLDAFGTAGRYDALAEELIETTRAVPPAPGFDRVRVPGDPEREREARCRAEGVPLSDSVWRGLAGAAQRVGVVMPENGA